MAARLNILEWVYIRADLKLVVLGQASIGGEHDTLCRTAQALRSACVVCGLEDNSASVHQRCQSECCEARGYRKFNHTPLTVHCS